jgi:IclR family acetate operon transcriptional repressor
VKHSIPLNQSVTRAFAVLEYLANADSPKDLFLISQDLGMNKSTTFRFISTLVAQGYVRQEADTGRYYLGSRVTWLATKFLEKLEVRKIARPILEALAHDTGETIHLAILDEDTVVYIDKIDGQQSVRMASRVGYRMPINSTSLGKCLLAGRPESAWAEYIERVGLKPRTPNTIVDPAAFCRELECVRAQNYAIDNVENEEGIRCIAAPIRDHSGGVVAAMSISGWTLTMTVERVQSLAPTIQQTVNAISRQLGYDPTPFPAKLPPSSFVI